jgi:hypothetical protein
MTPITDPIPPKTDPKLFCIYSLLLKKCRILIEYNWNNPLKALIEKMRVAQSYLKNMTKKINLLK